ncbi:MAG: GTPase [Pseudomonadota bacterium]
MRALAARLTALRARCTTGRLLRDGLTVVIAGPPNAGKSSLLNALAEDTVAIVTDLPGTTRDVLRAELDLDGVPVRLLDTAGLREATDAVEQEGVARTRQELARADAVLFVVDTTHGSQAALGALGAHAADLPQGVPIALLRNKVDLTGETPDLTHTNTPLGTLPTLGLSAATGLGLAALRGYLQQLSGVGPQQTQAADAISARARHLDALERADAALGRVDQRWHEGLPELVAEELRAAHLALMEITGEVTTETLLGEIFSRFCIGK